MKLYTYSVLPKNGIFYRICAISEIGEIVYVNDTFYLQNIADSISLVQRAYCSDGYEFESVPSVDLTSHEGVQNAVLLAQLRGGDDRLDSVLEVTPHE